MPIGCFWFKKQYRHQSNKWKIIRNRHLKKDRQLIQWPKETGKTQHTMLTAFNRPVELLSWLLQSLFTLNWVRTDEARNYQCYSRSFDLMGKMSPHYYTLETNTHSHFTAFCQKVSCLPYWNMSSFKCPQKSR